MKATSAYEEPTVVVFSTLRNLQHDPSYLQLVLIYISHNNIIKSFQMIFKHITVRDAPPPTSYQPVRLV